MNSWNLLIRTHHITSLKKVARLRAAAARYDCAVLIKYGSPPGIMYCEGGEENVKQWLAVVHTLRYKDYRLAVKPALVAFDDQASAGIELVKGKLEEVQSVGEFARLMEQRGVLEWWRRGMSFSKEL